MSARAIPEKISNFLVQRLGRMYCDSCIQERLGLRWRQQVQLVAATLAVTPGYNRSLAECCNCHQPKQVTQAVRSNGAAPTQPAEAMTAAHRVGKARSATANNR